MRRSPRGHIVILLLALFAVTGVFLLSHKVNTAKAAVDTCYWVGGDGNWNDPAHWDTDSGGAGGDCDGGIYPGSDDTAVFDTNSAAANVTINTSVNVVSLQLQSGFSGVLSQGANTITIGTGTSGTYTQAAGTFTGGSSNIDLNGSFTLSGGTFTSTTANFYVAAGWTHTAGGTFTNNSGTVVYDNGNATIDVSTTEIYNNLSFDGGSFKTIASGDTLRVDGTTTLINGYIETGTVNAKSTISVGAGWDGGTGNLLIDGAGSQSFTAGSGAYLPKTTLNQAATTINYAAGDGSIYALVLQAGTFTAPSGTLNVRNGWNTSAGGTFNHNNGTVTFANNNVISVDVNVTETFYDINYNNTRFGTPGSITIASGDTLVVSHNLTLTEGSINTASPDSNPGIVDANGTISVGAAFDGGNAILLVDAAGDQSFTIADGAQMTGINLNGASTTIGFAGANAQIEGALTIAAGTLTAPTGTLILQRYFTHTAGGTFTKPSGSTIQVSGGSNVIWNAPDEQFRNLIIDNSGGSVTVTTGTTLYVLNDLALTAGSYGTAGTIDVQGNVTQAAAYGTTLSASGKLTFSGGNAQTFTSAGGTSPSEQITVNKTVGTTLTLLSAAVFNRPGQDMTIQSGTLDLNGYNLTVNDVLRLNANGTVRLQGGETVTRTTLTNDVGSTVIYNGTGSYTTSLAMGNTYSNLTFDGVGGTWEPNGAVGCGMNLTITNGTFDIDGQNLTVDNFLYNNGSFRMQGEETLTLANGMDSNSGTVIFDGRNVAETIIVSDVSSAFYNLTINDQNGTKATFRPAAALDVNGSLTVTSGTLSLNAQTVNVAGSFAAPGTFTHANGTLEFDGTAAGQTINAGANTLYNMTVDGAGGVWTVTAATTLNVDHDLLVSAGTLTSTDATVNIDGNITLSGGTLNAPSGNMTVAGDWTNSGGTFSNGSGTVTLDGNSSNIDVNTTETFSNLTFAPADAQGKVIATGDTLQTTGTLSINEGLVAGGSIDAQNTTTINSNADGITSTLNFTGAGSHNFSSTNKLYGNVTVNKTGGTVTMQTNLDLLASGQSLTITSGSLNLNGKTLTITGNYTQGGGTIPATLGIDDTLDNAIDSNVLANSGAIDIGGNFTLSSGTFNSTSGTMKIAGNFNHTGGTFNCNNGTVELDGHDQSVNGSTTFCNFTKSTGTARTLIFEAGATQTVTGTLTLLGNVGQLLSLRSSVDGTSWNLHLTGTPMVSYVDVKDSNLTGKEIEPGGDSVNSGNNSALWIWGTTPTPTPDNGGGDSGTTDEEGYYSYGNRRTTATTEEEVTPEGAATILSREGLLGRGLPWWGWVAAIILILLVVWLIWMLIVAYRRRKENKNNKHYGDRLMKSIIWITLFITGSCLLLPQIGSVKAQDNNQTTQDEQVDAYLNEMLSRSKQVTQGSQEEMKVSALTVTPTASSQNINIGQTVTFGGTVTGGTITKYEWDFDGDGGYDWESASAPDTTHTYTLFGVYSATLRGTSSTGETGTGSITITVNKVGDVARLEHINRTGFNYGTVDPSEYNMPIASDLDGGRVFVGYTTCDSWPGTACANLSAGKTWVAMSPEQPGGTWTKVVVDSFTTIDTNHNDPTIIVDGSGYIHVWYDMHNSPWGYSRSNSPHTIADGFTKKDSEMSSVTGTPQISYPKAWRDQLGRVLLTWRDRGTNNGGVGRFGIYDPSSGTWTKQVTIFDDETNGPHGTPYVVGKVTVVRAPSGRLYTAAPWTDNALGSSTGHDLTFAYSDDDGTTWRRTDGTAYPSPITRASGSPDIIVTEAQAAFMQVDIGISVDNAPRPYLFFRVTSAGSLATGEYYMYLQDNNTWSAPATMGGIIPWWSGRTSSGTNGSIAMTSGYGTSSGNVFRTYTRSAGYTWAYTSANLSSGTWGTGYYGHGNWSDAGSWNDFGKGRALVSSQVSAADAEAYFAEVKMGINSGPTSSPNTIVTNRDVAANLKLMSYDVDEDALSYTIVSAPSHGTLSGTAPNLTYTPTTDYDGTDSFTFKSNDGTYDSNTATVNITVNEVYHNPTLPSLTNMTITAGDVVAYTTPAATVDAGDTVTYSAAGVPAGATFYAGCHTLLWPSTTSQTGSFTITVTATNSIGGTTSKSMTITSNAKVNDGSGKYSPP